MTVTKDFFQIGTDMVFEHRVAVGDRKYCARFVISETGWRYGGTPPLSYIERRLRDAIGGEIINDLYKESNDRT